MNFTKQLLYCFPVFDSVSPSILRSCRCFCCIGVFSAWSCSHRLWFVVITHISERRWLRNTAENTPRLTPNPSLHLQMPNAVLEWNPKLGRFSIHFLNIYSQKNKNIKSPAFMLFYLKKGNGCSARTHGWFKDDEKRQLVWNIFPCSLFTACHS